MIAGSLLYSFNVGSGRRDVWANISLTDDRYYYIRILRVGRVAHLSVDETSNHFTGFSSDEQILEFDANNVYIGGFPGRVGFSGCLKDPRYKDSFLPLQGSNTVARAEPIGGVQQGCDCPNLCGSAECEKEAKVCVQEAVNRCFSSQCVDFTCDLCSETTQCDFQQQRCLCPSYYTKDRCDVVLGHLINSDEDHIVYGVIAGIIMFIIILVIIVVAVRRQLIGNSEVLGVSHPMNNETLVTRRRFSGFQTVVPYKEEGGGESETNRSVSDSVADLERIRHVSALSGNSTTKLVVRCHSPEVSSGSSVIEKKRKREESEARTVDSSALSLCNVKTVESCAHESSASTVSMPIAKHASSVDVFAVLEARLAKEDNQIDSTSSYDKPIEYKYEGSCSNASSLSSICGSDHNLENEPYSFEFLHELGSSFKSVTDVYSVCERSTDKS